MPELKKKHGNLQKCFRVSNSIISRSISIPVNIKMKKEFPNKIFKALAEVL